MQRASKVVCCMLVVQISLITELQAEQEKPPKPDQQAASKPPQSPPAKKGSTHRFWDATNAARSVHSFAETPRTARFFARSSE